MTAVTSSRATAAWAEMPGWSIVADLTPPEIIDARRLRVLRRLIAAGLAAALLLCGAGFGYAHGRRSAAAHDLAAANARTTALTVEQGRYARVTQLQAATKAVDAQIAQLMRTEVDVAGIVTRVRDDLPAAMSLTTITVSLSAAAQAPTTSGSTSLDTSGRPVIGTVSLAGSSRDLAELAVYVAALSGVKGFVNVIPANNASSTKGATQWTVTLQLTDALYTHRFDAAGTPGGH